MSIGKTNKPRQVRVANATFAKIVFSKVFRSIGVVFGVIALLYLCFAATIIRVIPATSSAGFVVVKNNTHDGGIIPVNTQAVVDMSEKQGATIPDRLKQSFIPNPNVAVVEILSGKTGELNWTYPNILTVGGVIMEAPMPPTKDNKSPINNAEKKVHLMNEYVVKCIKGACVEGQAFIIPETHVLGIPLVANNVKDAMDTVPLGKNQDSEENQSNTEDSPNTKENNGG